MGDTKHCELSVRRIGKHHAATSRGGLLCAAFVCSVPLWCKNIHHKGTKNTEEAQRFFQRARKRAWCCGNRQLCQRHFSGRSLRARFWWSWIL